MDGIEDLNAIARPFTVAGRLVWRYEDYAAFGVQLVEENASSGPVRIARGTERPRCVIGRYKEQVGIAGIDADGVRVADLEAGSGDISQGLRLCWLAVVTDPVIIVEVGGYQQAPIH